MVGVVVLAAAAFAFAPAALLDRALAMRTQDRLRFVDATGVWWKGRGTIATADGSARLPIAWRVDPAPLLQGVLSIRLDGNDGVGPTGTIALRDGRVNIRELHLQTPAAIFGSLDARLKAIALGGGVIIDAPSFAWSRTGYAGSVDAAWDDARIATGGAVLSLGTISQETVPSGDLLAGTISNSGGDLTIDGTFTDRGGVVDAALVLEPTATAPEAIRRQLPLLGAPDGSGGVRVTWRSDR